jgi:hypothetical protein
VATLGEFSSLLQLGFGIGIGLSYFRAPVELRASTLRQAIDGELLIVRGVATPKAQQKSADLASLKLAFSDVREQLEKLQLPFMIAAIAGAITNWVFLILASLYASRALVRWEKLGLLFISVGYFVLLLVALELIAQYRFRTVRLRLAAIRSP